MEKALTIRIINSVAKTILVLVIGLVVLTIIGSIKALPFSSCLAPWWSQTEGDQVIDNRDVCAIDLAKHTGSITLCDSLAVHWSHDTCVNVAAVYHKNPQLCIDLFPSMQLQLTCLIYFQQHIDNDSLCGSLADKSSINLCHKAYSLNH